jgi:hypothetical protein
MRKSILILSTLAIALSLQAQEQGKPVVLISGNGNISINSAGQGIGGVNGGVGWAAGSSKSSVNKHDQTMEMAQDFLRDCPAVELTLSHDAEPDYFVLLNREGQATMFGEMGQSQVMVLNRRKAVLFAVGKKAKVSTAVKTACNAIAADWQANGRLPTTVVPVAAAVPSAAPATSPAIAPAVVPLSEANTVAIVVRTTAAAELRCKPETIASIQSDINAYVTSKGMTLGTIATSRTSLVIIVDRPVAKWIEFVVQGRDSAGSVLWSDKVSEGAWSTSSSGSKSLLNNLDKVHKVIDARMQSVSPKQDSAAARQATNP